MNTARTPAHSESIEPLLRFCRMARPFSDWRTSRGRAPPRRPMEQR